MVSIDDIIIARSGTPGATRLLVRSVYPTIFCGFIICCTPLKDIYKYYLLHLLKKYEGTSATKTGGSILQNVSQETLKNIGVILPQEETMIRFNKNVIPYYRKEQQWIEENYELETLRDWLLPMLMNGQARVLE